MDRREPRGTEHSIEEPEAGVRLDKWLAAPERMGSRKRAAEALERGKIFLDGLELKVRDGGRLLTSGMKIRIWVDRPGSAKGRGLADRRRASQTLGELQILFEDPDLFVVAKPPGLLTVPRDGGANDDTVLRRLEQALGAGQRGSLHLVHRIDRWTSGLVVVARNPQAKAGLIEQFRRREPRRTYFAIVHGKIEENAGVWEDRLARSNQRSRIQRIARPGEASVEAISHFRVEERFGPRATRLAVDLVTGQQNQIRVQTALRGFPLVGETLYDRSEKARSIRFSRQALHAQQLSLCHPRTGQALDFDCPIPEDLEVLSTRLRREERAS